MSPLSPFTPVCGSGPSPRAVGRPPEIGISRVISEKNLDRLERGSWLVMKRSGSGQVILFIDDPIFRHFWYSTFQPSPTRSW